MKNIKLYLSIISLALIICSCKEEGPYINLTPSKVDTSLIDTNYISATSETPQTKMVLIEDFTGVACINCPTAAQIIENLQGLYVNRILVTAIHFKNTFGSIPGSKYDFRTEAGLSIYNMLPGVKGGLPIGSINRTRHTDGNGDFVVLQSKETWSSYVNQELLKNTAVNIDISGAFIDTTSVYKLKVKLHYTQSTTDTQALTVYIIEDNIIDLQKLPNSSVDSHYVHKHVLRAVLTNFNGNDLNAGLVLNRVFEKEYKIELNPVWVKSNCSIIAFVHKKGYYFDIIQASQKALL